MDFEPNLTSSYAILKVYKDLFSFPNLSGVIMTTGTFDGVHVGHKQIINKLVTEAKEVGGQTVMLTFFPHPRMVLFPDDHGLKLLNSPEEKAFLLEKAGIDHLIIQPFSKEFSRLNPGNYIRDILVNTLHVRKMVVGYDHRFGRNREGNIEDLKEFTELYGYQVEEIAAQEVSDIRVSSTKIRLALEQGDVDSAAEFLGYNYMLSGTVEHGDGLGRKIGFPTANVSQEFDWKMVPGNGVYAAWVKIEEETLPAMVNIGTRPTVTSSDEVRIEAHIIDWNGDLYEKKIRLEFVSRLRSEKSFDSIESLARQLQADKQNALSKLRSE
jgi:riboflavin kinase/FMN adenylyltransferase